MYVDVQVATPTAEAVVASALWTRPWRNFFQYFEIMVSNGSMNPETLFEHG